jgi:hypothetical protein
MVPSTSRFSGSSSTIMRGGTDVEVHTPAPFAESNKRRRPS